MKPKTNPHSPEAALRLARQALSPSAHCRRRLDRGLAAAGILLPAAASGAVVAHAATVTATTLGASGAASTTGASVSGAASGAAPTIAHGSLVAAFGTASTTTKALLATALLAASGVGVTAAVDTLSPAPQLSAPNVHLSASAAPALEARSRSDEAEAQRGAAGGELRSGVTVARAASEPAPTPLGAVTSRQSAPEPRPSTATAQSFTQAGTADRQTSLPVASAGSSTAPIDLELATVRQTHAALARGDGALAQQLLSDLDRTVPSGALEPERRVCAVLAACQLQQPRRALQLAAQLLTRDGGFYRQRLASSCVSSLLNDAEMSAPFPKTSPGGN